jgi:hypothetical protein
MSTEMNLKPIVTCLFSHSIRSASHNSFEKIFYKIFIECILLRDQTNLIVVFHLRNSKNVYSFKCLLIITTCFDHPTGHHQVIQCCNHFKLTHGSIFTNVYVYYLCWIN